MPRLAEKGRKIVSLIKGKSPHFMHFLNFFSNFLFFIIFLSPSCFSNPLPVSVRCIAVKTKMIFCKVGSWITEFTYSVIKIILIRELVQF